ncbi:flippase-like domain-containing protein [Maribacter sp. MJ134]|uniref:lysylphosphatidylglycerol synthase transmembrane domain-containing protein n=1 Tax=Maribacter sp. MJ134 TaxID=2496865 RepID=UPI000F81C9EC|nr:lysylphosphatidylglycerol synthase transmembrane domain-containing protein [Maribacter sp. MJ134]AZQ58719.1 flippase-like domain-containing protein [Maribacter sp. MJ134]
MANTRKSITTALKLLISVILIYFVYTKINIDEIGNTLEKSKPTYLVIALFFFLVSKILAAFRLNGYFHQLDVRLTHKSNLRLYFLGMFYNLFLPGGIGGDAYKGYLIKKSFEVPTKRVVSVLVLDRLSGLLLLFVYACVLFYVLQNPVLAGVKYLFILGIPLAVLVFWVLNKRFFNYVFPVFWSALGYSTLVQLAQLISVWFIMMALGIEEDKVAYLVIFLVSSIVSVLPLTIGGIGSREVTFFYGASLLGLDETISVGISVVFFLITAVVSLLGIWYHFKKVELETTSQH